MTWLADPTIWVAFITLFVLEVVLGIDNVVFIAILADRLPPERQGRARGVGLALAALSRIGLLASIAWLARLTAPLFTVLGQEISGRDLVLIGGGLFLVAKSTQEIHQKLEGVEGERVGRAPATFAGVIAQILLLDVVFSLDSVITAVGLVEQLGVMIAAILGALGVMLVLAGPINGFIRRHPTVKMLALSFLLLLGVVLIAEGFGQHIPRGYIYFAMAFSVFVEMLNLRLARGAPVRLREPYGAS